MLKKYPIIKWSLIVFTSLILLLFGFGWWFINLLPSKEDRAQIKHVQTVDLPYLSKNVIANRGKVLVVVTSTDVMGKTDKKTGYELTELSRAYYVFQANGFDVDIASPKGGEPPMVIDKEDMGRYDYAFLNDTRAQHKVKNTIPVKDIDPEMYEAVYFAGGKGAMFDFPNNKNIQQIVRHLYQNDKVIGAVCHGPSALVNVTLDNGNHLLKNKKVSGFTNNEELLLIPDAEEIFPFLLQDKLTAQGATFNEGAMYLQQISHDNNLVTGQNPWSTWLLAETMISELGYTPKQRELTGEENAMKILMAYDSYGSEKAKSLMKQLGEKQNKPIARQLLAAHSMISAMQGNLGRFFNLLGLASYAKSIDNNA